MKNILKSYKSFFKDLRHRVNRKSLIFRFLSLITVAFIVMFMTVYLVGSSQMRKIIDESQNELYSEKIDLIIAMLRYSDNRLQKTEWIEVYKKSFQNSVIKSLKKIYYRHKGQKVYPFITDDKGGVIMHPILPYNSRVLLGNPVIKKLSRKKQTNGFGLHQGLEKWYTVKQFSKWNWVVGFSVPLEVKYEELYNFQSMLFIIMIPIYALVLFLLSIILYQAIKPIFILTEFAFQVVRGNLKQDVDIVRNDEIGQLAIALKTMQKSIRDKIEEHKLLSSILEATSDIVGMINPRGEIVYLNQAGFKMFGYQKESDFYLKKLSAVHSIDALERVERESIPFAIKNGIWVGETVLYNEKREEVLVSQVIICHKGEDGEVKFFSTIMRDISGQKKAEEERILLHEKLSHKNKMNAIGQLAGGVAHDFNNMLAGILGVAELLQLPEHGLNEKAKKYVGLIVNATMRAADLTTKLLAFGRKNKNVYSAIDLHDLIQETVELLKRTLDKKIDISIKMQAENFTVNGDLSALQNAIMNLAINAGQAMIEGGQLLIATANVFLNDSYCQMTSFAIEAGEYVDLEVRDYGCGIAEQDLSQIFDPFFTTKFLGKGTGLGLSAVYGIVEDHHGAISVYSELGEGSVFHVLLPCSEDEIYQKKVIKESYIGSGLILLVDDEELIRETMKLVLKKMGFEVIIAENGKEGLALFQQKYKDIDLVILDMIMPEMNGRETFLQMKEVDSNCKVVISSGFTKNESLQELKDEGLEGFLHKPFRREELGSLLRDLLG